MHCANCGTLLPEGAAFCPQCGTRSAASGVPGEPPPPAQRAAPANIQCQMCGREIPTSMPYCPRCGARAPVQGQVVGRPAPGFETPPLAVPTQPQYGAQQPYGAQQQPPYDQQPVYGPPAYAPPGAPMYGAQLQYKYAGFWPRVGAYLLDLLFAMLLAIIPGALLAFAVANAVDSGQETPSSRFESEQQDEDVVTGAFVGFFIAAVPAIFIYNWVAASLGGGWGKRIVGLRIRKKESGEAPGWGSGFVRVIVPLAFGLVPLAGSLLQLIDDLSCIWDSDKQTWHDKAAGTVVVVV